MAHPPLRSERKKTECVIINYSASSRTTTSPPTRQGCGAESICRVDDTCCLSGVPHRPVDKRLDGEVCERINASHALEHQLFSPSFCRPDPSLLARNAR
eukprot:805867-Rhodomonas_salina.1